MAPLVFHIQDKSIHSTQNNYIAPLEKSQEEKKNHSKIKLKTYLILIKYCAKATASGLPDIVIVRSVTPLSRSSQFDIRIMAPDICLISAIFVPPLPIIQPINSFGTVISCVC